VAASGQTQIIPESALPALQSAGAADQFWSVLEREATSRVEYRWSGYVLATLLVYLTEQDIDLMAAHRETSAALSGALGASVFFFTTDQQSRYLGRLNPEEFDGATLRRYYEEFNATEAEGVEGAMLDGIAFLRDSLAALKDGTVAVFTIA
jgi:hypothetical protein